MINIPDKWVVLKITSQPDSHYYKVLAGWNGSYLEGQRWRLNSGICRVERDGDYYLFHGDSGSIYKCHVKAYGANRIMNNIFYTFTQIGDVEILKDQDFTKLLDKQESDV